MNHDFASLQGLAVSPISRKTRNNAMHLWSKDRFSTWEGRNVELRSAVAVLAQLHYAATKILPRRSKLHHEAALEVDGRARDRVAVEEEPGQDPEVDRHGRMPRCSAASASPVRMSALFAPAAGAVRERCLPPRVALRLADLGVSMGRIARVLGVSATTVARWIRRFAENHREPLVRCDRAVLMPLNDVRKYLEQPAPSSSGTLALVVQSDWLQGDTAIVARPSLLAAEPLGPHESLGQPQLRRSRKK